MSDDKIEDDDLEIDDDIEDIDDIDDGIEDDDDTDIEDTAEESDEGDGGLDDDELSAGLDDDFDDIDDDDDDDVPQKASGGAGKLIFNLIILGIIGGGVWYGYRYFKATPMGQEMASQAQQAVQGQQQQQAAAQQTQQTPADPAPATAAVDGGITEEDPELETTDAELAAILEGELPLPDDSASPEIETEPFNDPDFVDTAGAIPPKPKLVDEDSGFAEPSVTALSDPAPDIPEFGDEGMETFDDLAPPMDLETIPVETAAEDIPPMDAAPVEDVTQAPVPEPVSEPVIETVDSVPATPEPVIEMTPETAPAPAATAAINTEILNQLEGISGRLESFSDRFSEIEATVSGLEAVTADQITRQDLNSIENSIQSLQTKVTRLEQRKPVAAAPSVSFQPAAPAPASQPQKTVKRPAITKKTWILRSAVPGTAWISQKGEAEMRKVTVGDTLDSVGKITSIAQEKGSWQVVAEKGIIRP